MEACPIREIKFPTFSKFISDLGSTLFPNDGIFRRDRFLFRGQGSSSFALKASFDRRFQHLPLLQRVKRYEAFTRILAQELESYIDQNTTEIEMIGLAQHYGVPTRLLDWTSSPLVASYFAFHERVTVRSDDRYVTIWALDRADEEVWNRRTGVEIARLKARGNQRASRQLGFATNLSTPDETIEGFVNRLAPDRTVLWKFNVAASDARSAFAFLDASNVRATELFGDIGGSVQTAVERLFFMEQP